MNRQVGRCTAVHESKRFPFFTINAPRREIGSGSYGETLAFLKRLRFVKVHQALLKLMEVEVTSDCQFLCRDEDSIDALRYWLLLEYENEQLERENPLNTRWEFLPFGFEPLDSSMVRRLTGGTGDETL